MKDNTKTRMTIFIKTKFKISEEIGLLWSSQSFEGKYNIGFGISVKFPSQRRKKIFKSVQKQRNYAYIKNAKKIVSLIGHLWSESDLR